MIRKLTATLALAGLVSLAPLAAAGGEVIDVTGIVRTGAVNANVEYTLFEPTSVDQLPIEETRGLVFGFPETAEVVNTALDDEDVLTTVRYDRELSDLADYYSTLFDRQEQLEQIEEFTVNEQRATGLYRYNDTLLRFTAEPVGDGLYNVVYNFEPEI